MKWDVIILKVSFSICEIRGMEYYDFKVFTGVLCRFTMKFAPSTRVFQCPTCKQRRYTWKQVDTPESWHTVSLIFGWETLHSMHYRALRAGGRDFRCRWDKQRLNIYLKRANPLQWMKYSYCKMGMTLYKLRETEPKKSQQLQCISTTENQG